ncbi:MAG: hypothetical protein COT09_05225 [Candidatus Hydromicrobium americanum]|nr:MAG: hypothetical protein COT09_05225 [Candidatus Hydromicrobium americanum]
MKNIKKEANLKIKKEIIKVFKVIITVLLVITFTVSLAACKEAPAVEEQQQEEEEKGEVIIPSETKEETNKTTPPTTNQETTVPTETTPQTVEYKGSIFTLPEGSEANPQTGEIIALEGNPYGVEAKTKIGQYIIDAFELNGQMEDSIALRPEVIEYMQKKIMEEDKEFRYPLPFDLQKAKGIKIKEAEDDSLKFSETTQKISWEPPKLFLVSNIPLGSVLLSPVNSDDFRIRNGHSITHGPDGSFFFSFFNLVDTNVKTISFKDNKIDSVELAIAVNGINLLPEDLQKKLEPLLPLITNIKIGMPFGEIIEKKFLEIFQIDSETGNQNFNSNEFSIAMCLCMVQGNEGGSLREATGYLQTASDNFLSITTEETKIPVSLMPANE